MKKSEIMQIIREEVEVILTDAEAQEFFDLDMSKLLDEMMTVSADDLYLAEQFVTKRARKEDGKDPKAKSRNRPDPVFDDSSSKVKDDKDHFPINTLGRARNALARASQYSKKPAWYAGTLKSLVSRVRSKVKSKYPSIELTKASAKPGKG